MTNMLLKSIFSKTRTYDQRGISLVIVLIFLVILSILGISAMQSSTLSSRIALNESDRNLAFQAAEAAIIDAERDLANLKADGTACVAGASPCRAELTDGAAGFDGSVCKLGRCCTLSSTNLCPAAVRPTQLPVWEDTTRWTSASSVVYGAFTGAAVIPVVSQQPRYLLEYFPIGATGNYYRVTAVGYGAKSSTQVMLQTTVRQKK